jgi:hypothetical protein
MIELRCNAQVLARAFSRGFGCEQCANNVRSDAISQSLKMNARLSELAQYQFQHRQSSPEHDTQELLA